MTTKEAATAKKKTAGGPGGHEEIGKARLTRRRVVWLGVFGFIGAVLGGTIKFFFPRVLYEPKTQFKIGFPGDFGLGVDTKYQPRFRIWVVKEPARLYVIHAKCTHLGCTPDWKPAENKFKCPCHGSGFDMQGVNFEGPAPRPLDRCMITYAPDGQILVDKSKLFPREKYSDARSYLVV